jgi:hypothetical protein
MHSKVLQSFVVVKGHNAYSNRKVKEHAQDVFYSFQLKHAFSYLLIIFMLYNSDGQPVCRGTLVCRQKFLKMT